MIFWIQPQNMCHACILRLYYCNLERTVIGNSGIKQFPRTSESSGERCSRSIKEVSCNQLYLAIFNQKVRRKTHLRSLVNRTSTWLSSLTALASSPAQVSLFFLSITWYRCWGRKLTFLGSGIGKECCLALAAEGARGVVLADINYDAALKVAQESESLATNPSYKSLPIAVDVCDKASVEKMVKVAVDTFGRIDYSVNSAGIGVQKPSPIAEADEGEMNRFWQVNVMGTFNCVKAVSKVMKEQSILKVSSRKGERDCGRGVILNLGSANSYMATPNIVQYVTAKHAITGLTKNAGKNASCLDNFWLADSEFAALDNAQYGIRVNAICPGWVDTPMVSAAIEGDDNLPKMMNSVVPMKRIASPEEIADVVLFMISPRSSYVTGVGWIVDGGLTLQVKAM